MATLDSLIGPEGQPKGRKFKRKNWDPKDWFEPIFKDEQNHWFGKHHSGRGAFYYPQEDDFEEYFEPQKTVTRWQWCYKRRELTYWREDDAFMSEDEAKHYFLITSAEYFKLERTAQVFPE